MKKQTTKMYCCHDELLANLYRLSYADVELDNRGKSSDIATIEGKGTSISIVADSPAYVEYDKIKGLVAYDIEEKKEFTYDDRYNLTSHEIFLYNILLSKCIENQSEKATISLSEIHKQYRNKRVGKKNLMDDDSYFAYKDTLKNLSMRKIKYKIGKTRRRYRQSNISHEHLLLDIFNIEEKDNDDLIIEYSLGEFGKTLVLSKRYSKLMPNKVTKIPFNQIIYLLVSMYVCRMIFINKKRKNKQITIKLTSVMQAICKYDRNGTNLGISLFDYSGRNVARNWKLVKKYIFDVLKEIVKEGNISNFSFNSNKEINYYYDGWLIDF